MKHTGQINCTLSKAFMFRTCTSDEHGINEEKLNYGNMYTDSSYKYTLHNPAKIY